MNYKVVVFGGAGFLGSHVSDKLTDLGYEVTIFDRVNSIFKRPSQKMVVGDITNRELVKSVIKNVDLVYHFAAIADIKEAKDNPIETANFNILGTMYILDACIEFSIKRFIFSSTIYVYSEHGSFYRSSKQACELFIESYHKEYGLEYTILRYGSLYGPRANSFNFIKNSIKMALIENKIEREGDGNEIRDYINVIDAAKSSIEILDSKFKNQYIMITGPQSMKVREILDMINEILGNKIKIEYKKGELLGHYQITPYSFRPKIAMKFIPNSYHDLGQGILDCIYEIYEELITEGHDLNFIKPMKND